MLSDFLMAGIVAAPLSSLLLFAGAPTRHRTSGRWPNVRRFLLAVIGTAVLAAIAAGAVGAADAGSAAHWPRAIQTQVIATAAALALVSLAWLPATRRWNARGHLCWVSSVFLFVGYLVFILDWTFASHLGLAGTIGGVLLWLFEVLAGVLACAYLWELCDALGTEHWRRRITARTPTEGGELPFVSLHVPAHNEPPDMVIATLEALSRIDYPAFEIIAIDDNTEEESQWRPVADWCAAHGVKFAHLEDWPGYKSGALNYALRRLTDQRAEVIGVVDSDYQIDPGFLRRCAPLFADPQVGFIQAPQDYRDWSHAPYYRRLYYSYLYFFTVSQPSRNERDGAIFAGTMGLIRRRAIEEAGGWDEWCITEDAELSLRLLRNGWSGLHVDQSWGKGVMPLTFEALKSQRYRWCFGRHPDPADACPLAAARAPQVGEPADPRPALVIPGRRHPVVRRPSRPGVLRLLAGRRGQPGHWRRRPVPQADAVPRRHRPCADRARAEPRDRAAAPRHRRELARRAWRVLHVAVHLAGCGASVGAGPVRPPRRVLAHAEDSR